MKNHIIPIVGRPNVGKSTLFNRLTQTKDAITSDVSGVTRDRMYGKCTWNGKIFSIVDTGGYENKSEDVFSKHIIEQIEYAVRESQHVIFLLDVKTGITETDNEIGKILLKEKKNVIIVVNKVDTGFQYFDIYEFYKFGSDQIYPLSSTNGSGTGELLDYITGLFEQEKAPLSLETEEKSPVKVSIVGRPNVGKSSLTNALIGEERSIVSKIPGTTRDATNTRFTKYGKDYLLVDTAGIRKKKNVDEDLEYYSVIRAIRSIDVSDVCVLMIDATVGFESQDQKILHLIVKARKGVLIAINKWDAIENKESKRKKMLEEIEEKIKPHTQIPLYFISVHEKTRILKSLEGIDTIYKNQKKVISTNKLNTFLLPLLKKTTHPIVKRKSVKFKHITQLKNTDSPVFLIFCTNPDIVKEAYKRFITNLIYKEYDFSGTFITIAFRKS